MNKFRQICLINIFVILISTFSFAANKIAYIDLDLILSESEPAKLLFSQLKEIEEKKMNKLKKDEIILKDEEQKILNSKNLLSKEEFNNKVRNFQKKVNLYNELKEENIQNLQQKRNKEILRFLNLINPLIEKVMEKNSIGILMEKKNIFIAKSNYDITEILIQDINKNIKEFLIDLK
jgi:outer membrane protein